MKSLGRGTGCFVFAVGWTLLAVALIVLGVLWGNGGFRAIGIPGLGLGLLGLAAAYFTSRNVWQGFTPPPGVSYLATDPELQASWDGPWKEIPEGTTFENVMRGELQGHPWLAFEEVDEAGSRTWYFWLRHLGNPGTWTWQQFGSSPLAPPPQVQQLLKDDVEITTLTAQGPWLKAETNFLSSTKEALDFVAKQGPLLVQVADATKHAAVPGLPGSAGPAWADPATSAAPGTWPTLPAEPLHQPDDLR